MLWEGRKTPGSEARTWSEVDERKVGAVNEETGHPARVRSRAGKAGWLKITLECDWPRRGRHWSAWEHGQKRNRGGGT